MQIELKSIKIADLIDGYVNDPDTGVKGYHGKLDIRPPYQREFRYDEKQQQAVIDTILKGFPLNIMYWSVDDYACGWCGYVSSVACGVGC